jgi:hypothetical protein
MIPITGLIISPEDPDYLNGTIFELGGYSLNEVFVDNDMQDYYDTELLTVGTVSDTMTYTNGHYTYTQNIKEYILTEDDIYYYQESSGLDRYNVYFPADKILVDGDYNYAVEGFTNDTIANLGTQSASDTVFQLYFTIGTYTDLPEAKTALAGTMVTYELTTPIVTQYIYLPTVSEVSMLEYYNLFVYYTNLLEVV